MCYTGKCLWEDYQGDCRFPSHILGISYYKCHCTMQEYIDSKNLVTKFQHIKERKNKIKVLKNKLLDNSL
jgi:hypothetical protein